MERQAGLGRSLEDVLDSMAPVEADPGAPGRVLFEPRDLERQVDQLAAEIGDVRERVQRLVGLVSDAAEVNGTTNGTHQDPADTEDSEPAAAPSAETPEREEKLEGEKHKKKKSKKKQKAKQKKAKKKAKKKAEQKAEQKSENG
jgi:hypothetical protein